MKMSEAFPSKYLKTADLGGKEIELQVDRVEWGDVGTDDEPETKPVLFFVGKKKGMILNKTNTSVLTNEYGDETDDWRGKPVIIYPTTAQFKGQPIAAMRIRIPARAAGPDDEIPF
jgi:hypothetical protein